MKVSIKQEKNQKLHKIWMEREETVKSKTIDAVRRVSICRSAVFP